MRIEEVEIQGYGKWNGVRFRFAPGINLLAAENEAGKTTLMEAVIALLYGMKRDYVKRSSKREEWERYRPWNGSIYGGRITYRLQGRLYRLDRDFASDDHRLYDAETLRELTGEYPLDARRERPFLQEQIGLTRTLFEELARIGPIGFRDGKNLMEWLHRLRGGAEERANSYHEVFAFLENKKREIGAGQGKGTLMGQAFIRLEEARKNLEKARSDLERLRSLERRFHQLQSDRLAWEGRMDEWERRYRAFEEEEKKWSDPEALYREKERLLLNRERWKAILKEWERVERDEEEAEKRLEQLKQAKRIDADQLEGLDQSVRALRMKRAILATQLRREQEQAERQRRASAWLGMAAAAFLAAGALLMSLGGPGLLLLLIGAVTGVLSFRALFRAGRRRYPPEGTGWPERDGEEERRLLTPYGLNSCGEYLRFREEQQAIHREEEEIRRRLPELHGRKMHLLSAMAERLEQEGALSAKPLADDGILSLAKAIFGGYESRLAEVQRKIEEHGRQRRRLDALREELQETKQELMEERAAIEREMARLRGEMAVYGNLDLDARENEYALAVEELERLKRRRRILDLAKELFEETLDEWNRMVFPEIHRTASAIYRQLTGEKYDQVRAGPMENFRLRAIEKESGEIRDHSQLSQGAEQQLYFAFRLALLQRFSGQTPLPVFLDDSFAHYDPGRLWQALAFLREMSARHQIFLFSCQGREREMLEEMGAEFACIVPEPTPR